MDKNTVITFHLSIGMNGCEKSHWAKLKDLIDFQEGMTQDEINQALDQAHQDWLNNNMDTGWYET